MVPMLLSVQKALACAGIGAFYLYTTKFCPATGETTELIMGPFPKPANPYEGFRLYFFTAEVRYHLRKPTLPQE